MVRDGLPDRNTRLHLFGVRRTPVGVGASDGEVPDRVDTGDVVRVDEMRAARLVLDAMEFDAECVDADIGWEFWRKEGKPLADRTIGALRGTNCTLFGAITNKSRDEANPKSEGQNVANPMAMLLTTRMMLEWLGELEQAARLEEAIAGVIGDGRLGTYDVKGRGKGDSTTAAAEEVALKL